MRNEQQLIYRVVLGLAVAFWGLMVSMSLDVIGLMMMAGGFWFASASLKDFEEAR